MYYRHFGGIFSFGITSRYSKQRNTLLLFEFKPIKSYTLDLSLKNAVNKPSCNVEAIVNIGTAMHKHVFVKTQTEKRKTFLFLKWIRVHLLIFKKATLAFFVYFLSPRFLLFQGFCLVSSLDIVCYNFWMTIAWITAVSKFFSVRTMGLWIVTLFYGTGLINSRGFSKIKLFIAVFLSNVCNKS